MQTLQILYESTHKNTLFFDRKVTITQKKTILYGPRKSGKTHLIVDHISHYAKGEVLYIDFSDDRIHTSLVAEHLSQFVKQHPIVLLVIEHFDFSFALPPVPEIILSTPFTCKTHEGFSPLTLYPLDFEEFIAFDKKHTNIEHLFNLYANHGTFPHIVNTTESDHHRHMQALLHLILEPTALAIFTRFCELQSTKVSLFQIYNHLKTFGKISKDKLYAITHHLIDQKLLFLVEKFGQPNAAKKVYQIDFALKNALTFKKDFLKRFENMVFLELMKRDKEIFYEEGIDFYLPSEGLAIICAGFAPQEVIERRIQKLLPSLWALHVKHIEVVTLSSESALSIEGMSFSISPFWEWALQG
jgi:uncharacterized protein